MVYNRYLVNVSSHYYSLNNLGIKKMPFLEKANTDLLTLSYTLEMFKGMP